MIKIGSIFASIKKLTEIFQLSFVYPFLFLMAALLAPIFMVATEGEHTSDASAAAGDCRGKIDIGPAFVHLDILESGRTVKRMDMWAVRGDLSYLIWKGLFVKPNFLYGNGGAAKGGVTSSGVGVGFYIPLNETFAISPLVGVTYSHVWTKINLPQLGLENLHETFKSWSPYLGAEIACNLCEGWRLYASFQYAWSQAKTSITRIGTFKDHSQGPTYALLLEKDLSKKWSVNIGAAYNIGLTKEKHGLRATGLKFGLAYWF